MTFTLSTWVFSNVANDIHACSYIVMHIVTKSQIQFSIIQTYRNFSLVDQLWKISIQFFISRSWLEMIFRLVISPMKWILNPEFIFYKCSIICKLSLPLIVPSSLVFPLAMSKLIWFTREMSIFWGLTYGMSWS